MSKLSLPLPPQISTDPQVNQGAMSWAAMFKDLLEQWARNVASLPGVPGPQREMQWAALTLTWTAAVASATVTVNHGLSATPSVVVATVDSGGVANAFAQVGNLTATTFDIRGIEFSNTNKTGTNTAYWIALH